MQYNSRQMKLSSSRSSVYNPASQDHNDVNEEEGTSLLVPPARDIVTGNIEELKRELQDTIQAFSIKMNLLTDQVNDLQQSNQEEVDSSSLQAEEHEHDQDQQVSSDYQNSIFTEEQAEDIQSRVVPNRSQEKNLSCTNFELRYTTGNVKRAHQEMDGKDETLLAWIDKVFIPNILRFTAGTLVLISSLVIILQNEKIIDLFDNFTALVLISEIENIVFSLTSQNYFNDKLKDETDKKHTKTRRIPALLFVPFAIFASVGTCSGWSYLIHGQVSERSFKEQNPECKVKYPEYIGDGYCDGEEYNTKECMYDGGDCDGFNSNYPNCNVKHPENIGDGECHGGEYYTPECGYEEGDCEDFKEKYPNSTLGNSATFEERYPNCNVKHPEYIGNGYCDGGEYYTPECGYEEGDCEYFNKKFPNCTVEHPELIENGECDGGEYNTKECMYDGGDCDLFNREYPNCNVTFPELIDNGECDGGEYNTPECGYEEGDCLYFNKNFPNCNVEHPELVGDGECNDFGGYNTDECGFDGGDCI